MIKKLLEKIKKGRNKNLYKSISATFLAKGLSAACNLLYLTISISYINPSQFGIWLTLSSVIGWLMFLDVGLGNGLKNHLGEALAANNHKQGKIYVSTAYWSLFLFLSVLCILFVAVNPYIKWSALMNVPTSYESDLHILSTVVFVCFCIQFLLQLINNIFAADQRYEWGAIANLLVNGLVLIGVIVMKYTVTGSLLALGITVSVVPVIIYTVISLYFFNTKYRTLIPSIKWFRYEEVRQLFSIGVKFFIIQIYLIVIYQCSNLIISNFYGTEMVTAYNIAQKYFWIIIVLLNILMGPFWSAFTEAYFKKDYRWIKSAMAKLRWVSFCGVGLIFLMVLVSATVYKIWIGEQVTVPLSITIAQAILTIVNTLTMPYMFFMNGTGKIFLQTLVSVFGILFFLPIAFFFAKATNWGPGGIIAASIICNLPMLILYPIHYYRTLAGKGTGIWR